MKRIDVDQYHVCNYFPEADSIEFLNNDDNSRVAIYRDEDGDTKIVLETKDNVKVFTLGYDS